MTQNAGPVPFDPSVPNVARIYDFMLGGKDNYAADRLAAEQVLREIPHSELACRQNRAFLGRVVRYLAEAQGITQFLDIGSGLPTRDNVHQIVQQHNPGARVVYADYDPIVATHARALLADESSGVTVVQADVRDQAAILAGAGELIDFTKPVAVLLFAVLHFLTDDDQPYEVVRTLADALAPGSALAISHITGDATPQDKALAAEKVYQQASAPAVPRTREDILRFFDGLQLIEPGLTDINQWPAQALSPSAPLVFYGGLARKDG
jgi:SAM-dependent methyltransferase